MQITITIVILTTIKKNVTFVVSFPSELLIRLQSALIFILTKWLLPVYYTNLIVAINETPTL